jgi:hypothetical protein
MDHFSSPIGSERERMRRETAATAHRRIYVSFCCFFSIDFNQGYLRLRTETSVTNFSPQIRRMSLFNYQYLRRDHLKGLSAYKVEIAVETSFIHLILLVQCCRHITGFDLCHAALLELVCRSTMSKTKRDSKLQRSIVLVLSSVVCSQSDDFTGLSSARRQFRSLFTL